MGVGLVVKLSTIKHGRITSWNHKIVSNPLTNYVATSDSVQHSRSCVGTLDAFLFAGTGEGANFTLKEVHNIITID